MLHHGSVRASLNQSKTNLKQHSLHCAIFRPSNTNFHYHPSDDTKHDALYFNEVLRDLIQRYDIKNEDAVIQSDTAPIINSVATRIAMVLPCCKN